MSVNASAVQKFTGRCRFALRTFCFFSWFPCFLFARSSSILSLLTSHTTADPDSERFGACLGFIWLVGITGFSGLVCFSIYLASCTLNGTPPPTLITELSRNRSACNRPRGLASPTSICIAASCTHMKSRAMGFYVGVSALLRYCFQ